MTSATASRNTPQRPATRFGFAMAAGARIWAGTLVALDAAGHAVPAVPGLTVVGVAEAWADNSAGPAGVWLVAVTRGCYRFDNGGDITFADIGSPAYALDDSTVSVAGSGKPAGIVRDVDAAGVWIEI
jgi:hypothetical protein